MPTARETYNTSCASANTTKAATVAASEMTRQVTVDAHLSVVGYNNVNGDNVALRAAIATANTAKLEAIANAEKARQSAVEKARDTLRDSGDRSAV